MKTCKGSIVLETGCGICPKCKKELKNIVLGDQSNKEEKPYYQTGWICPLCGGGNSPTTSRCPCVPLQMPQITC